MQLKFTLPALAALALSSAPLASADSGGFAASCRDVKIFQRGNWEMSAICRRSDGSEHYTELNLDLAIHNGGGNLAVCCPLSVFILTFASRRKLLAIPRRIDINDNVNWRDNLLINIVGSACKRQLLVSLDLCASNWIEMEDLKDANQSPTS